jgi:hypothetical protein
MEAGIAAAIINPWLRRQGIELGTEALIGDETWQGKGTGSIAEILDTTGRLLLSRKRCG